MKKNILVLLSVATSLAVQEPTSAPPEYYDTPYVAAWKAEGIARQKERREQEGPQEGDFVLFTQPVGSPQQLQQSQQVTNINIVTVDCSGNDTTTCCIGDGCCAPVLKLLSNDGFVGTYVPFVARLFGVASGSDESKKE